jgi:transcriptional regulator with XRE-family HTH domain
MDDRALGRAFRALRIQRRLRQIDVAEAAGVAQTTMSKIERGELESLSLRTIREVATALGMTLAIAPRWRGGEMDRLLAARHSALHEDVAARFASLPGWLAVPEVTFSRYGERGAIDVLAWHQVTATLLVIELKTEIVDVQELISNVDRKRRLAPIIARERGWIPSAGASAWVAVSESRTNRRRVEAHRSVLRAAFPSDGRSVNAWLLDPDPAHPLAALSFWPSSHAGAAISGPRPVLRVRRPAGGSR